MATIIDVAKLAGVSKTTVSRYLNGNDIGHMSDETRKRIIAAIKELDFNPSDIARSLKRKSTNVIGIVINDMTNPFFLNMIQGIETELKGTGYNFLICNSDMDIKLEIGCLKMLEQKQIDGIIVIGLNMSVSHIKELNIKIPIVLLERDAGDSNLDSVRIDNRSGSYEAVKHLIDRGHKKIAHISGPRLSTIAIERHDAYIECLTDYEIDLNPQYIVKGNYKMESGYESMKLLMELQDKPTAVFCANDNMALGALRYLIEKNISVPGEIALVGYDDIPVAQMVTPALTTVRQPVMELSMTATRLLLKRINTKDSENYESQSIVMESDLIIRKSS